MSPMDPPIRVSLRRKCALSNTLLPPLQASIKPSKKPSRKASKKASKEAQRRLAKATPPSIIVIKSLLLPATQPERGEDEDEDKDKD